MREASFVPSLVPEPALDSGVFDGALNDAPLRTADHLKYTAAQPTYKQ